jgi:hypothetical protein
MAVLYPISSAQGEEYVDRANNNKLYIHLSPPPPPSTNITVHLQYEFTLQIRDTHILVQIFANFVYFPLDGAT